jgi:Na+/citrate or Na+/malate symporter
MIAMRASPIMTAVLAGTLFAGMGYTREFEIVTRSKPITLIMYNNVNALLAQRFADGSNVVNDRWR